MKALVLSILIAPLVLLAADLKVSDAEMPRVPATEPDKAVSTLQVREGFRAELVAHEPLVMDPVAMAFDEEGRLFVAEMRDYSERRDEKMGRIKLLEDSNGDGRYDKTTVYARNLPWPTAVICWNGGIFVGASPDILYLKDNTGDGTADVQRVVFSGFGAGLAKLNVQQLLNSFTWGIDNRIHGALGGNPGLITNLMKRGAKPLELRGRDFSFDPRTFDMRAESGGGQWGMSFDDEGNKFVCSNSRHIAAEMYEDRYAARNRYYSMPPPDVNIAVDGPAAEVFRLSPDEPWRVIRTKWRVAGLVSGPVEGGGRASGYFTGASGVMIYRGDAFPPEYRGDAFVADCGSNLIHRKKLRRDGLNFVAERAADERRREFIASRDNWFRPVSFANAPDGTVYFADMYRETVEHPWSLPPELKSKLDLNSGNDRGRIYRVVPEGVKLRSSVKLKGLSTPELVKLLEHANGWHQDTAARLLIERNDTNTVPLLRRALRETSSPLAKIRAISALRSFNALEVSDLRTALKDSNAVVRVHGIKNSDVATRGLADGSKGSEWNALLAALGGDSDPRVRYQLALSETDSLVLSRIIAQDVEQTWTRAAVLNGLSKGAADVFAPLALNTEFVQRTGALEFLREAARLAGATAPANGLALCLDVAAKSSSPFTFANALSAGMETRNSTLATVHPKLFGELSESARKMTADEKESDSNRIEAASFLGTSRDAASRSALVGLLDSSVSAPLQGAAVRALAQRRELTNVLARWSQLARSTRETTVALLMKRRDGALALVRAAEQGAVARNEIAAGDVERLVTHADANVRNAAQKVFKRDESSRADVIKKYQPALSLKGDATRGRQNYQQRCASCHRAGNEGFAVGPDLASVAGNGKEKLLVSLVDPNAEVAAAFVAYSVETKRGESFVGVLAGESPLHVLLKMPNGETTRLGRETISATRAGDKSLMPEGLEEGLSVQDMADLLEFIMTAKPAP